METPTSAILQSNQLIVRFKNNPFDKNLPCNFELEVVNYKIC